MVASPTTSTRCAGSLSANFHVMVFLFEYPPVLIVFAKESSEAVMVTVGAEVSDEMRNLDTAALGFPAASVSTPAASDITISVPSAASHSSLYTVAEVAVQPVPLA